MPASKCQKKSTKKYTSRKSPPFSASECKNKRRKGNNGKFWNSKKVSNGVYRWFPSEASKTKKSKNKSLRKKTAKKSTKSVTKKKFLGLF